MASSYTPKSHGAAPQGLKLQTKPSKQDTSKSITIRFTLPDTIGKSALAIPRFTPLFVIRCLVLFLSIWLIVAAVYMLLAM
jgi:hypothetical protein